MPQLTKLSPLRGWSYFLLAWLLMTTPGLTAVQAEADISGRGPVQVVVDARVELLSVIFRLAGHPEYSRGRVASYVDEVEAYFGPYRDHPAVKLAAQLRRTHGVSYDACMSMAVHLGELKALESKPAFDPLPADLDQRWGTDGAKRFLEAALAFVEDTSFQQFFDAHRPLYQLAQSRMQHVLDEHAHLEWFDDFFGRRPEATFHFVLGMLNGPSSYGARCQSAEGRQHLYCILGVWRTDADGMPVFDRQMLGTVVHEFCHSYTNPIVDRHETQLESAGAKIFPYIESAMRRQAYGHWKTVIYESMVRACVVRYIQANDGPEAARREIAAQKARSFVWIGELAELLGEYETRRDEFADLDAYFPHIVDFFDDYADQFAEQRKGLFPSVTATLNEYRRQLTEAIALAAARPKVVPISPANEATDVDPATGTIRVVFDRPMANGSWSMVGGGPNFPELDGAPSYDRTRTVWTVPVKLKPSWTYRLMLNSDRFQNFKSQEGVPLSPVTVTFTTAAGEPTDADSRQPDEAR